MDYLINLIKKESPPHKHKNYEIIVYTRGEGILHTNKKDIETAPGKIIIIPPVQFIAVRLLVNILIEFI